MEKFLLLFNHNKVMGVLKPLERNAEEVHNLKNDLDELLEATIDNLQNHSGLIINDRHDLMDKKEPYFFLRWRSGDVMSINSMEELQKEIKTANSMKEDLFFENLRTRYAKGFADKKDVEPDYDQPIESYGELDELLSQLEILNTNINDKIVEKTGIDTPKSHKSVNKFEYDSFEHLYASLDNIDALPLIEGIVDAQENIKREKENLLAKAIDEHREHKESIDPEYDRASIPHEPINWEEHIDEDYLRDFFDISDISNTSYGDTLHMMMEQVCEGIEGVDPEYTLHFQNKGHPRATDIDNRIDNSLQPDALTNLIVYEFKHMPVEQKQHLEEHGTLEYNQKLAENVQQVNKYLNELDMPFGMLVNISHDMDIEEYVVEQHPQRYNVFDPEGYIKEHAHKREEYDFDGFK